MIRGEWSIALEEQAQAFADYNGVKGQRYLQGFFEDVATKRPESVQAEGMGEGTPMGSMMLALWRLMEQRIAVVTEEQAQRAVRRRAARIHQEYDRLIRVVTLRRPRQPANGDEPSTVDWSHRWIVRGHWRLQPYPARGVHRHIWIAPFVKGPDDRPLELPVDRVFRLAR